MLAINPLVFDFFKELAANNTREWFEPRKAEFKALENEIKTFGAAVAEGLNRNDRIEKTKVFRIYRDVRFSKDKTPYKTHFAMAFHREKPALRGGYYLHIKPGESFVAAGFWDPNKEDLLRIRQELAMDADEFRTIVADTKFQSLWGNLQGEEVKTAPKGFSKGHPDIDLIKKKQFIFTRSFTDGQILAADFLDTVVHTFEGIRPFFDFMSHVLTTDSNGVSLLD